MTFKQPLLYANKKKSDTDIFLFNIEVQSRLNTYDILVYIARLGASSVVGVYKKIMLVTTFHGYVAQAIQVLKNPRKV